MRQRHQTGGIKKQRGRWVGMFWADGQHKSRVLGLVKDMTKSAARVEIAKIVAEEQAKRAVSVTWTFGAFIEKTFFPYYSRKWKASSTKGSTKNRMKVHLVEEFNDREITGFQRDELQDLLDRRAARFSFSTVDHLRWDLKQIFDMALAEGLIVRNPALLLFTPREAQRPVYRTMSVEDVTKCFDAPGHRERLIAKLAVLVGMRPGEIFALTWGQMTATYVDIRQRVYRGIIDSPKTDQSFRKAALSQGLIREIEIWRSMAVDASDKAFVFPSERMTPLAKENVWRRLIQPKLEKVGLGWINFQVMRRTHATLMNALGIEGKLVADQLGHSLDVNQNVYTRSAVESRQVAVDRLEGSLRIM